ncbi:MAG: AAC(3) family N-acetyltransferase [Capsulimonadales bacterium]|nr:AAC(3) family N-acetyltransferase [Capsulimonadales bacterium]
MSEEKSIRAADLPRTRASLANDLRKLGLAEGSLVFLHSSLSRLGWVCGSSVTVLQAIFDVLGPTGTLVTPAFSGENSDPARWQNPPVPEHWWPIIRETMPVFDPQVTPTRGMGRIVETFRTWPGVRRSYHPVVSFCACGPEAEAITRDHPLNDGLGENSPLGRLYQRDAQVLMLGTAYECCTCFHLSEYRSGIATPTVHHAAIQTEQGRQWVAYEDIDFDSDPFEEIGAAWDRMGKVRFGLVGSAPTRLFPLAPAVDFATERMRSSLRKK